ncbi:unnamed protein product [Menidia menidia]|uniref:(Atlantic silverside) hypothetical protein n=1 Tax=Menidia menidia TaxID=238744 RepID=A0A8S4BV32_9TELE|nr:unnamed protein product [Menidia menidia]
MPPYLMEEERDEPWTTIRYRRGRPGFLGPPVPTSSPVSDGGPGLVPFLFHEVGPCPSSGCSLGVRGRRDSTSLQVWMVLTASCISTTPALAIRILSYLQNKIWKKNLIVNNGLCKLENSSDSTTYFNYFIKNNYKQNINPNQPYQDIRIITAFRKNKNLKDHLVRAIIPKQYPDKREINHNYFKQQHWIKNHWTGQIFRTPIHGNIDTTNCIYIILCNNCNLKYVGETGRTIRARFYTHKQNIIHKKNTHRHLVKHILSHGWEAIKVSILQSNPHWTIKQRKFNERLWITKLKTTYPHGLNERAPPPQRTTGP